MKPTPSIKRWLACTSARAGVANISPRSVLSGFMILGAPMANAADIQWTGATASYNTPGNWAGGVVPGGNDNAFVNNGGTVQILPADPTWSVNDFRASNGTYVQSGSRTRLGAWLRMAVEEGSTGTYEMSGGRLEIFTGNFHIGERGQGTFNFSGGTVYQKGGFSIFGNRGEGLNNTTGIGIANQSGGTFNTTGDFWVGHAHVGDGVFGTYNMTGGTLNLGSWLSVGRAGGDGEFLLTNGTINKSQETAGHLVVGIFDGGVGSTGYFRQDAGTVKLGCELWLGQGGNSAGNLANGTYELNGGLIDMNNWIAVGREGGTGILNINGGTLRKLGGGGSFTLTGTGIVNQTGGLVDIRSGSLMIAENNNANGTYNLSGTGVVDAPQTIIVVNNDAAINGSLNLGPGGTLRTGRLFKQGTNVGATATATFDGGTLVATAHQPNFISGLSQALLAPGGLTLDTNGFEVATPQVFSGGGTLTKNGRGTLGLSASTAIEGIQVNAGTLDVDGSLSSLTVSLADGASLSGVGTISADVNLGTTSGACLLANSTAATPLAIDGSLAVSDARIDFGNHGVATGTPITVATYTGVLTGTFSLGRPGTVEIDDESFPFKVNVTVEPVRTLTWTGATNSTWDIFSTANWNNGGNASNFAQGDTVNLGNAAGTSPLVISGPVRPAAIAVDNTNTITLQGTPADDITGPVVITKAGSGKLIVGLDTSLSANQTAPTVIPSTVTVNAGELQVGNGGTTGSLGLAAVTNNSLLSFNFSGEKLFPNSINGTGGSLAKTGAGNVRLTGTVAYTGTTTISGGRLTFQTPAVPGTGLITNTAELEIVNNGAVQNVDSIIGGSGKLLKAGTGEVWLRAANTFTGDVEVVQGPNNSLNITNAQALGTTAGKTVVRGFNGIGGQYVNIRAITGGGTTIAEPFELISDSFGRAGIRHEGGTQTLTLTGPIAVASTAMAGVQISNLNGGSTLNIQGDITGSLNGANLIVRGPVTAPINITGSLNIADQGDLVVTDDARVRLGAAGKTYQGFRTNIAFGHLRTLVSDTLPANQTVLMCQNTTSGAKWILGESTPVTQTIAGLSSTAVAPNSGIVGGAATDSTLTVNQDLNSDFNLPLGGSGTNENRLAFVKSGKGRLTLGAINTHVGSTTVSGGTLLINANTISSSAIVQPGATLGGIGRVKDFNATGNASATADISPGNNGIGIFNTNNNAVFGPYSAYNWQLQDWTGATDRVTSLAGFVNITATSANPVTIRISQNGNVTNFTEANRTFIIASGGFGIQNFAADKFVIDDSGFTAGTGTWTVRQDGSTIVLDYTAGASAGSYATWAIAKGIPGELPGEDFDKDGLLNLLEYGLGLDPKVPNGSPGTFSAGAISFTKGVDAVANGDVVYRIETSPTLGVAPSPWTPVTPTVDNATTISYTLPTGQPKVFARLVVTKSP